MRKLERAENTVLRWMCSVTFMDRKSTTELMDCLGVVAEVVGHGRLRWYRHVERKDKSDLVSACRVLQVEGARKGER